MSDRGMKKWAPYSSLIEQATCLAEMRYKRNKVDKPIQSQDLAEKINNVLSNYHGGPIKIKFYYDGYFYVINKEIKRIDIDNKKLIFDTGKLNFSQIVDIEENFEF